MGDDELKILIEASLDEVKSIQNILADLKQLQNKVKTYRLKVLAGLDKTASSAQIKSDLAQITKTKSKVKIVGEVDKSTTRKNVDAAIKNLKNALGQIPKVETTANVNVSGGDEVDRLRTQMANAGESAAGMASKIYIARSALQLLRRTAIEAKETIIELDSAVTDLGMATGQSREKTYELLQDYNRLAVQMGATTTQIAQAADQWLRQGHSISDTTTLIEDAMVLSKVSQLDSAAATEYLTSAMKGYKVAVQDVIGVVDKLAAVDLESATDAGGLAEAMSRTAVTANMAGISMNRLLGYLATVGEVTQKSMSSVGESFKTIFTRMSDIKANKLELIDADGTTEILSDVEATLKNVGIDLRETVNEYNNYGDVLDNLAAKWDTLSQVQQNALAKAFAGTRQRENFRALMENYSAAMKYMDIAADSAGTATEKFSLYADSIEAKTARFTAAIEGLALDTVDAGFVGDLINAGTAIIELIERTDLLKAALVGLGAGAVLKGISTISSEFLAAKQNILNLGEAVQTLRNVQNVGTLSADTITRLGGLTKGFTDEQLRLVLSTQQLTTAQMTQILTAGGLTEAEAAAKLQTLGFATAEGAATAATFTLSGAITGLGTAIKAAFIANPIGMTMLAVGVTYELVKGVLALHDALTTTAEEARETADELHTAFEETTRELESLNSELETSKDRLAELLKLSEAGTISIVEQEELNNLEKEVHLLEQRERFLDDKKEREAKESNDALEVAFDKDLGGNYNYDLYGFSIGALNKERDELLALQSSLTNAQKDRIKEIDSEIERLNNQMRSDTRFSEFLDLSEYIKLLTQRYEGLYNIDPAKFTQAHANEMEAIKEKLSGLGSSLLDDYIQKYEGDSDVKAFWQGLADDIDRTINKVELFTKKIAELPNEATNKLTEQGSNGNLTAEDVTSLAGEYSELQAAMDDSGVTAEDVAKHFNALSVSQSDAGSSAGTYTKQLSDLSDTMSEMKSAYDMMNTAQEEMASGSGLSTDTIEKLAKENENYLDYLYEENGVIKLNTEAWKANADAMMHRETAEIQKEIDSINAKNDALRDELKLLEDQRILGDPNGEYAKRIAEIVKEINKNSAAIEENQDLLRLYTAIYQQISGDGNDAFSSLTDVLTSITGQYDLLNKAQDEFAKSGALSASTLSSIVAKYPEMQQSVDLYIAGLKSEKELLADLSAAYGVDLKNYQNTVLKKMENSTEFYNSLADNQKKLIDELGEAYGIDLKNFQTIESKKLEFQSQIIKNLASNYSKYANASLEGLKAQQDAMLIHGGYDSRELKALSDAINAIDNYNYAISHIATGAGLVSSWSPDKFSSSGSSSSSGLSSAAKEVEEYVAAINDYREALERLERVQEKKDSLELRLSNAKSLEEELALRNELLDTYQQEQDALHALNDLRDQTISENVDKLRGVGFEIEYDPEQNHLFIKNLEHINDLVASGKGKYESVQEATNAYRKEVEELVNATEKLNEANKDGSSSWWDLYYGKRDKIVEQYQSRINDKNNQITLTQNWLDNSAANHELNNVERYTDELIAHYKAKQQEMHALAEYYRSKGYSNTSDEITALSDGWWECEESIKAAKQAVIDYLADIVTSASEAIDSIQNVYSTLKDAADEFAANGGYISIDAIQAIVDLGPQYMQYLEDEGNQLVINEERINKIIAAKTEQLALDNAMTYVERLKLALQEDSIEDLNELLYATTEATSSTWGLVYANLALLDLEDDQYEAALHNINAIRALADVAIAGIGKESGSMLESLNKMKDGLDDILKYVMDMLKQNTQDQIDNLNDMKTAYSEIISAKKASLEASKNEASYEKKRAAKLKEIAKLQAKIDILALDDSREAQAERAKLMEEMAELQEDLNETQADKALDTTKDALDDMEDAYHDETEKEIKILEDSISSYQKLYDMAIDYISNNWDTLYDELIGWNAQYGSVLNSEITTAWENCLTAAQRYGSYVSALGSIDADINSVSGSSGSGNSNNTIVGPANYENSYSKEDEIHATIKEMYQNAQEWHTASENRQQWLSNRNKYLGEQRLKELGINAERKKDGAWYVGAELLFDKYKKYTYHTGGFVGDEPLKPNERYIKVENDELVLTSDQQDSFAAQIARIGAMTEKFMSTPLSVAQPILPDFSRLSNSTVNNVTNNSNSQPVEIHFGDTIINGAKPDAIEQHKKVDRAMMNEVSKWIMR